VEWQSPKNHSAIMCAALAPTSDFLRMINYVVIFLSRQLGYFVSSSLANFKTAPAISRKYGESRKIEWWLALGSCNS
jgi:hypothetical protein